jgi:hypothetical protein
VVWWCGQGYLATLGIGNLMSVGMLSINVLVSTMMQDAALDFLPYLEVATGIPTGALRYFPLHS